MKMIVSVLKTKAVVNMVLSLLETLAVRTDNGIDNVVVSIVRAMADGEWETVGKLLPVLAETVKNKGIAR